MNAKKNRVVFFISICICIFFYFISDISFINEGGLVFGILMDIFIMVILSMIVVLGYAFLTFNRDDHAIFMDNLDEMLKENHRKDLEKAKESARQKDDSKDNSSNAVDEEAEEETAHPFLVWLEGFSYRLEFVGKLILFTPLIFLSAIFFGASGGPGDFSLLYSLPGALLGFIVAYIIYKIFVLFINFLFWIIFGK